MRRWLAFAAISAASLYGQLSPPNDMGVSVGHIHLIVADPEAQKKIWSGVLGAEVIALPPLELYKIPGVFVVVQKAGRTVPTEGSDGSTVNHFGFLVKSYDEIKKKLTDAGLKFTMDNAQTHQIIAELPEKVRVEFTEDKALTVPMKFHHIHEANVDQEKVRDWYVKTFGATPGTRGAFPAAFVPGGEVDVLKATGEVSATKGRTLDHIGFEVKDLEAFCKKLDAEGTRIELTEGLNTH